MVEWFKSELRSQIISLGITNILLWASPFFLASVAIMTGWLEHIQFMWIIMSATVTFAMTAVGILSFYLFSYARTPKNKLQLEPLGFAWEASENDSRGMPLKMGKVRIIVNYKNNAHFPMSVITDGLDVVIDGNVAVEKTSRGISLIIGPNQNGWFRDDLISLKGVPCANFDGKVSLKVRYGRPNKEIFHIAEDVLIRLIFDSAKGLYSLDVAQDVKAKAGGGT